jgi:alkyl hydroperoxide reductase subunit AhpC
MPLRIGDKAPDFTADTTKGKISFHEWLGDSWGLLFSHPKDFTPVCTTELGSLARLEPEFAKRNVKLLGLSVDPVEDHARWLPDIKDATGFLPNYPLIGDHDLKVAKLYDMLPADSGDTAKGRTAATNATVRTVYIIGPDKLVKAMLVYPMSSGRNFQEVLRLIDSAQLTAKHKVSTPADWKPGEDVIISGNVSDEDAKKQYPGGWKSPKPYMRVVPQPKG